MAVDATDKNATDKKVLPASPDEASNKGDERKHGVEKPSNKASGASKQKEASSSVSGGVDQEIASLLIKSSGSSIVFCPVDPVLDSSEPASQVENKDIVKGGANNK
jgi:hypothetical protein